MRGFGLTDCGRVRDANEDHFVVVELARALTVHQTSLPQAKARYSSHRGYIFLVADGMGGHRAGEVASALTLESVEDYLLQTLRRFSNLQRSEEAAALQELTAAVLEADARIFAEATRHPEWEGMGTTLTMAFAVNWKLFVAHAGDSRCYVFSGGELHQLTRDHTVVAELARLGALSPEGAAQHPYRHVVTNVVGGRAPGVMVEMHNLELKPDDVLLLCSDGLTNMVSDARLAAVLQEEPEPRRVCERLAAEANEQGGEDNITVIVARVGAA
jgi:protein phosphatase